MSTQVNKQVDLLLNALWEAGGTDLLFTAGRPPLIRVQGELTPLDGEPSMSGADVEKLVRDLLTATQSAEFATGHEIDIAFDWRDLARVRGNAFRQRGYVSLALRVVPRAVPTVEQLGLPDVLTTFARQHQGLVLVTGPTGSGKSTTLAALIDLINRERACHIITIEDPIEYVHDHKKAAVNQREVGSDTASFPAALRSALREDPDVLLVGEMRDLESIRFALTIAETGHLVFATLHTNDTTQSIARMIDVFPAEQQDQVRVQLAAAISGIVYQRLIPRVDGGSVAAYEILVANTAVRNLIKEGKTHQLRNSILTGQREGMCSLEQSLSQLVAAGTVSYEDAVARSLYPKDVARPPMLREVSA